MLSVVVPPPATPSAGAAGAGAGAMGAGLWTSFAVGGTGAGAISGASVCVTSFTPLVESSAKARDGD